MPPSIPFFGGLLPTLPAQPRATAAAATAKPNANTNNGSSDGNGGVPASNSAGPWLSGNPNRPGPMSPPMAAEELQYYTNPTRGGGGSFSSLGSRTTLFSPSSSRRPGFQPHDTALDEADEITAESVPLHLLAGGVGGAADGDPLLGGAATPGQAASIIVEGLVGFSTPPMLSDATDDFEDVVPSDAGLELVKAKKSTVHKLWSWLSKLGYLVATNGERAGAVTHVQLPSDIERERQSESEVSIWSIFLKEDPTCEHLSEMVEKAVQMRWTTYLTLNAIYEGDTYYGQHAAHIAVVEFGDNVKMLKRLIARGADIFKPKAKGSYFNSDGSFFQHYDVNVFDSRMNNVLHVLAWWGFYDNKRPWLIGHWQPAPTAILDEQPPFPDHFWIENFADFTDDDALNKLKPQIVAKGNRFLGWQEEQKIAMDWLTTELLKAHEPPLELISSDHYSTMKDLALREIRSVDHSVANVDGLTPLGVAAQRGKSKMVIALLDLYSETLWTYGAVTKKSVPLTELDTYVDKMTMNHTKSALTVAVMKEDPEILQNPIFMNLLRAKWILYGSRIFLWGLGVQLLYMLLFTLMIFILPNDRNFLDYTTLGFNSSVVDYQYDAGNVEGILVLWSLFKIYKEAEMMRTNWSTYFAGFGRLENFVQLFLLALFFTGVALRVVELNYWETLVWGLYAIIGLPRFGPLGLVVWEVLTNDALHFGTILLVFLLGFSQAFWLIMGPFGDSIAKAGGDPGSKEWGNWIPGSFVWLVLGNAEKRWAVQWAGLIMEIDEKILSKYNQNVKKLGDNEQKLKGRSRDAKQQQTGAQAQTQANASGQGGETKRRDNREPSTRRSGTAGPSTAANWAYGQKTRTTRRSTTIRTTEPVVTASLDPTARSLKRRCWEKFRPVNRKVETRRDG
ncbi:hypothetical protein DFJ73DRAFT_785243 [Zopfochytrium polystomum]|nr:hypothetical protein DFJ73DRAFT_785243 [Zopfochytrium polystomum]